MSYAMYVMLMIFFVIVGYFIWCLLLWATWNYTIPVLVNSLAGSPPAVAPAFSQISYVNTLVFGFLLIFLALPIGCGHKLVTSNFYMDNIPGVDVIEVEEVRPAVVTREYMR